MWFCRQKYWSGLPFPSPGYLHGPEMEPESPTLAAAAAAAKSLQSCPNLCNPIDGSPSAFPIPGILQARTLEWVAISFSNAWKWKVKSDSEGAQSCLTLSDPMDCSLPGSSVHGIFQARVLEWVAIAFSTYILTGGFFTTEPPVPSHQGSLDCMNCKKNPCKICLKYPCN